MTSPPDAVASAPSSEVVEVDPDWAQQHVEALVDVWSVAFGAATYGPALPDEAQRRRSAFLDHADYPGWRGWVVPGADDPASTRTPAVLGLAYGYPGRAGRFWHDAVTSVLDDDAAHRWLDDAFEVAEVHLLPELHGRGLGRALLTALLAPAQQATAVLSTPAGSSRARMLYDALGFVVLHDDVVFVPGGGQYVVLGRDLPLTPAR